MGLKDMLGNKWIKRTIFTHFGLATALSAGYVGYNCKEDIDRLMHYFFKHNIQVEQGTFKDPSGLETISEINSNGNEESYLHHSPSGKKVQIMHDMMPPTEDMYHSLLKRATEMQPEQAKQYLIKTNRLEDTLYSRLMQEDQ